MAGRWCIVIVLAAALAGCTSGGDGVVVIDGTADISTIETTPAAASEASGPRQAGSKTGHLVGHVLDDAYAPVPGVEVALPAFGLHDMTDRRGAFEFTDLPAGTYLFKVDHSGYLAVETMLDVSAGDPTRVRVVLRPVPPPEPYHETFKWIGFMPVTGFQVPGLFSFHILDRPWPLEPGADAVHGAVLEATMDPHAASPVAAAGFAYWFDAAQETYRGEGVGPLRVEIDLTQDPPTDAYHLQVTAQGRPVPEVDKEFEVFLTLFYHGPPPEGWSVATA